MTWEPAPRPEWVRHVNDGHVGPLVDEAARPFDRDDLLDEAAARAGADLRRDGVAVTFGGDGFVEPLDVLVRALEDEADLHLLGRWITRRYLLRLLGVRIQVARYVRQDPGVVGEEIRAPWFVTGAPRTGTSILHALLACDPRRRAPLGWELLHPVPPPHGEEGARVALADAELRLFDQVTGTLDAIHEYGARNPKECLSAMSFELRSEELVARYHVPSYLTWFQRCDMRPAYEYHHLVLQLLQRRSGPTRWVLKSPVHLHSLPTLLDVYPEARIAFTHRDPLTVVGSVSSLVATLRWVHSDRVDMSSIARYHADLYGRSLDALVDAALPEDRVHHGTYDGLLDDPLGAVARVYAALGEEPSPAALDAMAAHLAAHPQGRHGEHRYSLDGTGLDEGAERARFARYCSRFGVSPTA